jgi:fructose-bisphosphate aldolase, class I
MTTTTRVNKTIIQELKETARAMVAPGKGILAADESNPTIKKRFDTIHVESTQENRRSYREMLFTTPGLEEYISGVILFDETLRQSAADGTPFSKILSDKGIIPGIKVDKGLTSIPNTLDETVTQGLDGLSERLEAYKTLGARFAKWRAVIQIGTHQPSQLSLALNAHSLARYAAVCQSKGIVPIIEPEILMTGSHTLDRCERAAQATLDRVFEELAFQQVFLEGMILKPSMVTPGDICPEQVDPKHVAQSTIKIFKRSVPAAVPGIAFLSGGQSSTLATLHLNAMNKHKHLPWELSFSYGRALQEDCLAAWKGEKANTDLAQKVLFHRAKCNGAARFGKYSSETENSYAGDIGH